MKLASIFFTHVLTLFAFNTYADEIKVGKKASQTYTTLKSLEMNREHEQKVEDSVANAERLAALEGVSDYDIEVDVMRMGTPEYPMFRYSVYVSTSDMICKLIEIKERDLRNLFTKDRLDCVDGPIE
jgi:hypothetical protein